MWNGIQGRPQKNGDPGKVSGGSSADLLPLRPLCVSVAGGERRKTLTQFSNCENRENVKNEAVEKTKPRGRR